MKVAFLQLPERPGTRRFGEPWCRLGAVARRRRATEEELIFKVNYLATSSLTGRPSTFLPG